MHEFFRMGREERAKNLAEAERQRLRADKKELRFRRRLEDRFIEQTAAKARRRSKGSSTNVLGRLFVWLCAGGEFWVLSLDTTVAVLERGGG